MYGNCTVKIDQEKLFCVYIQKETHLKWGPYRPELHKSQILSKSRNIQRIKIRALSSKYHDSGSVHNILSARSQCSARRSVRSVQLTRRAAQLAVRNATRDTVMLPRAASVKREKTSSSGSDEDIGIPKTQIRIRPNCNSFPCLLKRAAFCLRNATHRWWNPGECLLISARIRWKWSAAVQQMVCVWYLSAAHCGHDPHARPCNAFDAHTQLWARLNTLTGSSALTWRSGSALIFLMLSQLRSIHPSLFPSAQIKLSVSTNKNHIKEFWNKINALSKIFTSYYYSKFWIYAVTITQKDALKI